jgi:hypothetical protein
MNPSVHPGVRETLTKEVEHRSIKTGKKIPALQLKADKFYDRAIGSGSNSSRAHFCGLHDLPELVKQQYSTSRRASHPLRRASACSLPQAGRPSCSAPT